jgi:hypothetical protein
VMCAIKNLAYWESVKATLIMTKREKPDKWYEYRSDLKTFC